MYTPTAIAGSTAAAGAGLASTGVNTVWQLLAGFALLGAGLAIMRIIPRRQG
jgi:hypothetical protein